MSLIEPSLALLSEHTFNTVPVGSRLVGISLTSKHDLDVTAVTHVGAPVVVQYDGFLLVRSADRVVQLSGQLGKGSFASLSRATRLGVLDVAGRAAPTALTDVRGGIASTFSLLFFEDASDVVKARQLFATGSVLELRTCPEPLLAGSWIAVIEVTESRLPYADWARKFDIQFVETDKPF